MIIKEIDVRKNTKTSARGFTLIEILVVVVILGILGAVVAPQLLARPDQARVQAAIADLRQLGNALDMYRLDNYTYPSSDQGLDALVTRPSGFPEAKNWNIDGYLKNSPVDPWGTPYVFINTGQGFELLSFGADATQGGEGISADLDYADL